MLEWLRLPEAERPSVLTVYYSDLDTAGHDSGPGSPEVGVAAARVDRELGRLVSGVETLGLQARVHWIVVSDHGMAQLSGERVIVLDDLVDVSAVEVVETGSMLTLNPKGGDAGRVYASLRGRHPHLRVFRSSRSAVGLRAGWTPAGSGHRRAGGRRLDGDDARAPGRAQSATRLGRRAWVRPGVQVDARPVRGGGAAAAERRARPGLRERSRLRPDVRDSAA